MRAPFGYRVLLLLLPSVFRRRHGAAMETAFADAWADALRRGFAARWRLWLRELADVTVTAARLRRRQWSRPWEAEVWRGRMNVGRWEAGMAAWRTRITDDLVLAVRFLRRNPGFTAFAALTAALGIGSATAMFSALDGVMLHPLPYAGAERLVGLYHSADNGNLLRPVSPELVAVLQEMGGTFEGIEQASYTQKELSGRGDPALVTGYRMHGTLPAFLGVTPVLGRSFTPEETADSGRKVVLISNALWKSRFGGSRTVLGETLELDGEPWTIVGVMPPRVGPPDGRPGQADIWLPLSERASGNNTLARLREGVTPGQARTRMEEAARRTALDSGDDSQWEGMVMPLEDYGRVPYFDPLRVLMAAVTLLLMVSCVNVANLLLTRASARRREMAIRSALGAGAARILRQAFLENFLLATLGGVIGVGLAAGGLRLLDRVRPEELAVFEGLRLSGPVLAFSVAASLFAGLIFGLLPALHATRSAIAGGLRRGDGGSRTTSRLRWMLVAGEVALSFSLLVGSVMVITSLRELASRDVGFRADGLVTVSVRLPRWSYSDGAARRQAFDAMVRSMRGIAGVREVTLATGVPPGIGVVFFGPVRVDGRPWRKESTLIHGAEVSDRFLTFIGQPLRGGRDFTAGDADAPEGPVIITEYTARQLFPEGQALGRRLTLGNDEHTVVGIAGNVLMFGLGRGTDDLVMYAPLKHAYLQAEILVRAAGEVDSALLEALRSAVRAVEPDAVVDRLAPVDRLMGRSIARQRFTTTLLTGFGVLALVLSAVGLYGVVSQVVAQRTREIGIRLALGAVGGDIRGMILRMGAAAAAAGLAVGVGLTLAGLHLFSTQVFGLQAGNVAAYIAAAAVIAGTTLAASWLPARRAARVDPAQALRAE